MALNYLAGLSREELESALLDAQRELMAGKVATQAGAGDVSSSSRVEKSLEERIILIWRALYALDPISYPLESITRTTATKIVFNDQSCGTSV